MIRLTISWRSVQVLAVVSGVNATGGAVLLAAIGLLGLNVREYLRGYEHESSRESSDATSTESEKLRQV